MQKFSNYEEMKKALFERNIGSCESMAGRGMKENDEDDKNPEETEDIMDFNRKDKNMDMIEDCEKCKDMRYKDMNDCGRNNENIGNRNMDDKNMDNENMRNRNMDDKNMDSENMRNRNMNDKNMDNENMRNRNMNDKNMDNENMRNRNMNDKNMDNENMRNRNMNDKNMDNENINNRIRNEERFNRGNITERYDDRMHQDEWYDVENYFESPFPGDMKPGSIQSDDNSMPNNNTPNNSIPNSSMPNNMQNINMPNNNISNNASDTLIPDMTQEYPLRQNYALVRVLHAASNYVPVNVTIGARTAAANLRFGTVSQYTRVTEGYRTVVITSAASNDVLVRTTLPFSMGTKVTIVILNMPNGLELVLMQDNSCRAADAARGCIRAANFTFDGGPYDILLKNGRTVFSDIRTKEVTLWKQAQEGDYEFYVVNTPYPDGRYRKACENTQCINSESVGNIQYAVDFYLKVMPEVSYTACIIGGYYSITPLQVIILEN